MPINIRDLVKDAVIEASTTFREDQIQAYQRAIQREENDNARWVLDLLLENARIARSNKVPLCDDTGIPHVLVELGSETPFKPDLFHQIEEGVVDGLRKLPGRPMAVCGDDIERIEQSRGLASDPGKVIPPSILVDKMDDKGLKIHVLMLGGGPEIRSHTYRVFHQRDHGNLFKEALTWMRSEIPKLGCTPCIPALGIGRTHFEASSLMLKAMAYSNLHHQSSIEKKITDSLNSTNVGALGLGGSVTALGSMVKIGPQRASGVRIVCMRPCCCVEPRKSSIYISQDVLE
ncbi:MULTISPECIES: fumarate hydratase [Methanobacterium]|jgi:fumarate hydratase subunit alpha|uniref:Fe-S type, tartrate/fumarate subfamily hydro-lyase subunit alpha n=1 Tax=Methanobacterium formicicum TaxID=2162 RepID=A0A089ZC83_METFO|nr:MULTISPECIES: fumarate hydratase [Methanobacterium]AIS31647.1 fumarate hydratase FumA3 [Methanobacterium formicicum]KUK75042.1 MAG: Fe-S type, tartrate/fumarate subfamily hydro-lyase subunit alpha [Methanobacterium sp. 42_16]MBF4475866.1 fumarate hydratase [Methanobacterium formicicum]CEL25510.1 Fe-S type, tartrate/fumarate subfamily hydro-lyase subunit alpha [Methanobacterium formicicum]